jgi:hypothetical protein
MMGNFRLEKWYMDATDDAGRAFIGYSAKLSWKNIKLSYNGFTFRGMTPRVVKRNSFSHQHLPDISENEAAWRFQQVSASWKRTSSPVHEVLLELPEGDITWSCHFPQASAVVQHAKERLEDNAMGYVEKITLSIPPWKIPIQELHWGRFLSPGHTVIWIRWVGPVPRTLTWHNGVRYQEADITTESVIFDEFKLSIDNKKELRNGDLVSTVFSKFPVIAKLFPKTIMQLRENKWVSDGLLMHGGQCIAKGKIIHEHVIW